WASPAKTSAAPPRSWARHAVIWFGWTSNCCANSASVFSPFKAANATLALKAALWFRRGRLLITSPVQQPYWLHSGQQSTYPDVQISRATSALDLQRLHETLCLGIVVWVTGRTHRAEQTC